jgi:basic membrane protein A
MKKFLRIFVLLLLVALLIVGCGAEDNQMDNSNGSSGKEVESKKIAFITGTGGLGDKTFNDLGYSGLKKLIDEGIEVDVVEPKALSEFEGILRSLAESDNYALIISMGNEQAEPVNSVAPDYPKQNFMLVDDMIDQPNVASVTVDLNEGGFLSGVLASELAQKGALPNSTGNKMIGIVGGMDVPLIRNVIIAYNGGAKYANPDVQVEVAYAGSFSDPGKGAELAQGMFEKGVDVVTQAAGGTGLGVFEAAKKTSRYAIGFDANQNDLEPDHVIASCVRRLDTVIDDFARKALAGEFKGGQYSIGVKDVDRVTELVYEKSNVQIPDDVKQKVLNAVEEIKSGKVVVPKTFEEVDRINNEFGRLK